MASFTKTQIDQLGERLKTGKSSEDDLRLLDSYRRSFSAAYDEVLATIRRSCAFEPTGRPAKSTTSIVEKLRRETMRLSQMQDIAGCRLVVPDMSTQNTVVETLSHAFERATVIDRRATPSYGYRAVHVVVSLSGKPVEVQVRTTTQHAWAEFSEKVADVVDPAIKYGGGPHEWRDLLLEYSRIASEVEARAEPGSAAPDVEWERRRDRFGLSLKRLMEAVGHLRRS